MGNLKKKSYVPPNPLPQHHTKEKRMNSNSPFTYKKTFPKMGKLKTQLPKTIPIPNPKILIPNGSRRSATATKYGSPTSMTSTNAHWKQPHQDRHFERSPDFFGAQREVSLESAIRRVRELSVCLPCRMTGLEEILTVSKVFRPFIKFT